MDFAFLEDCHGYRYQIALLVPGGRFWLHSRLGRSNRGDAAGLHAAARKILRRQARDASRRGSYARARDARRVLRRARSARDGGRGKSRAGRRRARAALVAQRERRALLRRLKKLYGGHKARRRGHRRRAPRKNVGARQFSLGQARPARLIRRGRGDRR